VIEKPCILISSIGRTGTEFFAKLFGSMVPASVSLHEPDIIKGPGVQDRVLEYGGQLRRAGPWRLLILKALGRWTLVTISDLRFRRALGSVDASRRLLAARRSFVAGMPGAVYVESNLGYYGLLDLLPEVFTNHRAIYLVRDGRDWVRSALNWGEVYGKSGLRKLLGHAWPTARDRKGDPLAAAWDQLPKFERVCWLWVSLNRFALENLPANPNARLFRFEDVFVRPRGREQLDALVRFATEHLDIASSAVGSTAGWLDRRIHESTGGFPAWPEWTIEQKTRFEDICGPFRRELGYGE
jgi:hypothetical protein